MTDEERLRRTLTELAPRATPDDRAFDGLDRAITRRRRRRAATRVSALIVVVGVAVGLLAGRGGDGQGTVENPPASGEAPSTAPTTPPPGATRVPFGDVTFLLPAGWVVAHQGGDAGAETMCIAPAGNSGPRYEDCAGLLLYHGDLPGYRGGRYVRDGTWGFAHGEEPAPCPVASPDPGTGADDVVVAGAVGKRPIDTGLRDVGDHRADYDQWFARCRESNFTFTPRAWYLPTSRVVILDVLGHPETGDILASFQFDSDGD
jgi:hypothetical protein